jgi:hypothetical protein
MGQADQGRGQKDAKVQLRTRRMLLQIEAEAYQNEQQVRQRQSFEPLCLL